MKHVLIGLGNPGKQYENNRHNAGFLFIDFLLKNPEFTVRNEETSEKLQSTLIKVSFNNKNYLFVKPQTFMNRSGEAVKKVLNFYKYSIDDAAVAFDDLDIPFGSFKIHEGIGPRSHNGVLSIENTLGTKTFTQIRIGVDNPTTRVVSEEGRIKGETYVLQNFTNEEMDQLINDVFPQVLAQLVEQSHV